MEYKRKQYYTLVERIGEPRLRIQVLMGPRQVGKSTLIDQVLADIGIPYFLYNADGVNVDDSDWISRSWQVARNSMALNQSKEAILVIDEIQKINNWSEIVKREWDIDTRNELNLKVVLLGSSRLMLRKGLTESLAGRFELIRMGHWSYTEMNEAFGVTLDEWIYYGGYPGAQYYAKNFTRWRKYIKESLVVPAIEKDVILTTNIYKPALMKQLFELGCSYSSELLSLTKILGQLQDAGNVTTLSFYLSILDESNLLTGLYKYANDEARKRQSIPKLQVYNNALMTAYKGRGYEKDRLDPQVWGRWVESAIGCHLLNVAIENDCNLYYWRDKNDEVDYVLEHQGAILAIEVKSGRRGMNSGLPRFGERYKPFNSIVVGTDGISIEEFLKSDIMRLLPHE
ncbi:MAG: ATP-binding protein [Paludibacteraceae bacterium]|nr:ATP-binding protein [Paludibacteraceae bacterium]